MANVALSLGVAVGTRFLLGLFKKEEKTEKDIPLPTSEFGSPISNFYGAIRKDGCKVIWALPLKEVTKKKRGGKGGGRRNRETDYLVNMAVLVGGDTDEPRRILCNSKLVFSKKGDVDTDTKSEDFLDDFCTIYTGSQTTPDPHIVAHEGSAPSFHGKSYIVFKDYPVSQYEGGTQLPRVDVEFINIGSPVDLSDIFEDILIRAGITNFNLDIDGTTEGFVFENGGETYRSALEYLMQLYQIITYEVNGVIHFTNIYKPPKRLILKSEGLGTSEDGSVIDLYEEVIMSDRELPSKVDISFRNIDNNHDQGYQQVYNPLRTYIDTPINIDGAIVATDNQMVTQGLKILQQLELQKHRYTKIYLPPYCSNLSPGDLIYVPTITYKPSEAMVFNGVDTDIQIDSLNATTEGTLEFWAYLNYDSPPSGFNTIFEFGNDSFWVGYNNNRLRLYQGASSDSITPLKTWVHFACVWSSNTSQVFINGQPQIQNTGSFTTTGVGAGVGFNSGDTRFKGYLDEIRVWDVVRTPSEILNNYNNRLVGNESNLVLLISQFEELVGLHPIVINGDTSLTLTPPLLESEFKAYQPVQIETINIGANLIVEVEGYRHGAVSNSSGTIPPSDYETLTVSNTYTYTPNNNIESYYPAEVIPLDLPLLLEEDIEMGLYIAVSVPNSELWVQGVLFGNIDDSDDLNLITSVYGRSVIGTVSGVLGSNFNDGDVDNTSTITVTLTSGLDDGIPPSTTTEFNNNTHYALIGSEIVVFQNATETSTGVWSLSNFKRGYRGTVNEISTHVDGERFILLSEGIVRVPGNTTDIGRTAHFKVLERNQGFGDVPLSSIIVEGNSLKPFPVNNITAKLDSNNNFLITWDKVLRFPSATIGETVEQYRVEVLDVNNDVIETFNTQPNSNTILYINPPNTSSLRLDIYKISSIVGDGYRRRDLNVDIGTPLDTPGDIGLLSGNVLKYPSLQGSEPKLISQFNTLTSEDSYVLVEKNESYGKVSLNEFGGSTTLTLKEITTLPYTILPEDDLKELYVTVGSGDIILPVDYGTIPVGFRCLVSLDVSGVLRFRGQNENVTLLYSGGSLFNILNTVGTVQLRYRGSNVWKVEWDLSEGEEITFPEPKWVLLDTTYTKNFLTSGNYHLGLESSNIMLVNNVLTQGITLSGVEILNIFKSQQIILSGVYTPGIVLNNITY